MIYQYSHRLFPRIAAFLAVLALAGAPLETTAADQPRKISIAQARTLPLGTVFTVAGSVTTPSGAFESSFFDKGFALQDHTAGIYVSLPTDLGVAPRRRAKVTGTLQDSFGLLILAPADPDDVHLTGHGPPIQPKFLQTSAIGEASEGLLVKVVGTITQAPSADLPFGFKFFVDDGSREVQIFVNVQTGIDVSGLSVGQLVSVTGFSSQFDTHYEIDPRSPADIVVATSSAGSATSTSAAVIDGTCTASITMNFAPPATQPLPPNPGPATNLHRYRHDHHVPVPGRRSDHRHAQLHAHAQPDLHIGTERDRQPGHRLVRHKPHPRHSDKSATQPRQHRRHRRPISATITSGRFNGDQIVIANLRDPLALIACLTTGLAHATGTTSLRHQHFLHQQFEGQASLLQLRLQYSGRCDDSGH